MSIDTDASNASIDRDAERFGRYFEGGWQLGLYVARSVHKQPRAGRPPKSEPVRNKVACAEFAAKAGVSERTVQWYYDAWGLAAEAGYCTPAEQLSPGNDDPRLAAEKGSTEQRELWRKFYRQARHRGTEIDESEHDATEDDSPRNHGGGYRGQMTPDMTLSRAKTAIGNINGLTPDAAEKQSEICRLIDELLASIQPATESN